MNTEHPKLPDDPCRKAASIYESPPGWTSSDHETLYPDNFNLGLASFIARRFQPDSVLEFGSGMGDLARFLASSGSHVDCIEPILRSDRYDSLTGPFLYNIDLFDNPPLQGLRNVYDLVISIEVAEHIKKTKHATLFDFLVSRTNRWLIFSGARPGQGGHGHIAERPEAEWRSEITGRGMIFHANLTKNIRKACDAKNINHRRNLQVFELP